MLGELEVGELAETELESTNTRPDRAWRFIAPERKDDWAGPSTSCDVYSLAAVLLEILAVGRLSLVQQKLVAKEMVTLLAQKGLSSRTTELISDGLDKDPDLRPSMREFSEKLESILGELSDEQTLEAYLTETFPAPELPRAVADGLNHEEAANLNASGTFADALADDAQIEVPTPKRYWADRRGLVFGAAVTLLLFLSVSAALIFRNDLLMALYGPDAGMVMVTVESDPALATISLPTGEELGRTPLKIPMQMSSEGAIELVASRRGFKPQGPLRRSVPLSGRVHFQFTLEPRADGPGTARILTEPPGAEVVVDGDRRGESPIEVSKLFSAYPHEVEVSLKGYLPEGRSFTIEAGDVYEIKLELEKRAVKARRTRPVARVSGSAKKAPPR